MARETSVQEESPRVSTDEDRPGTRERLIAAASNVLARNPAGPVRLTEVLADADASPSSLYHFFGSLSGLVQEAKIARFEQTTLIEAYDTFKAAVLAATTRLQLADALDAYLEHMAGATRTPARRARASAVLSASSDDVIRDRLWETQVHLYTALIDVLSTAVDKGFISEEVDMLGLVHFTDALFFGYLLTEALDRPMLRSHWYRHARESIYVALFGDDGLALSRRT